MKFGRADDSAPQDVTENQADSKNPMNTMDVVLRGILRCRAGVRLRVVIASMDEFDLFCVWSI